MGEQWLSTVPGAGESGEEKSQPSPAPRAWWSLQGQAGRRAEASPGWKSSDSQVRGVPPARSCPFQRGSSTARQTSPRGTAPRTGRCCPAQGRRYTLRQGKWSPDLYEHCAGGWWAPDLAEPPVLPGHGTALGSWIYSFSEAMVPPGAGEIRPTQLATRSSGIEASAVTESWVYTLAAIETGEQVCKRDTGALPTVPDQQNQDTPLLPAGTREVKPLPQAASLMGATQAV